MPSTSSTPRINQEQTLHVPRHLEPILKQTQTHQDPRLELEPRIKLETPPLKRKRVQEKDLRSPVCTPNSSVKVCNGPWGRHIRSHRSSHGHCNKCMWANNRWFWCRRTPLDLKPTVRHTWLQARPINTPDSQRGGGVGGWQGLLMGGTPIASCRGAPAPVRDTLRNWRWFCG